MVEGRRELLPRRAWARLPAAAPLDRAHSAPAAHALARAHGAATRSDCARAAVRPQVVELKACGTVKSADDITNKTFSFTVQIPERNFYFACANEKERNEWVAAIGACRALSLIHI